MPLAFCRVAYIAVIAAAVMLIIVAKLRMDFSVFCIN